jgi:phage terminase small subunit
VPKSKSLTPKQDRFCQEYLVDLNATQAAIRAGYSEKTANVIGHENLNKPEIQERIQAKMNRRAERTEITADRVLEEIARIAFSDISEVLEWDGRTFTIKPFAKLTKAQLAAIAEMNESVTVAGASQKIKFHDKLGALEKLGKHLGLFKETIDLNINPPKPLEEMTDEELAEYRASLVAIAARGGKA